VSADEDTVAVTEDVLLSMPKGTVIQVITPAGSFELAAESGAFRDWVLSSGTAPAGYSGRRARYGGMRLFWPSSMLAQWVAQGRCRIEIGGKK